MTASQVRIIKKLRAQGNTIVEIKAIVPVSCQEIHAAIKM